jgi:hypothetical protein
MGCGVVWYGMVWYGVVCMVSRGADWTLMDLCGTVCCATYMRFAVSNALHNMSHIT